VSGVPDEFLLEFLPKFANATRGVAQHRVIVDHQFLSQRFRLVKRLQNRSLSLGEPAPGPYTWTN
jgi:hypothetical protein